ncbi:MAG TPA: ATP-grasp domain-containing protein [Mycobacteriales bacterium]
MARGHVVLVDTYETAQHGLPQTARHIAPAFRAAGYDCVRVQSGPEPPEVYQSSAPALDNYVDNILHNGDIDKTVALVSAHHPVAVVAGGEYGVRFADLLSEQLGVPSNGTALSAARRDKYLMIETIKAAGLHGARQIRTNDVAELCDWHRRTGGRIVVKPVSSAGGDGVSFCTTVEQTAAAYQQIVERPDIFSEPNNGVVAQEYLVGDEYIVNTVSRDGLHRVCEIWKSSRFSVNGVVDLSGASHLVPRHGPVQDELAAYSARALDALGVRHGPAHVELKMTPQGPCLIELGARLSGGDLPYYAGQALGAGQIEWMVDAYVCPERFRDRHREAYQIRRFFAWVAMISPVSGTLRAYRDIDVIRRMESFHEMWEIVHPGGRLERTVDDTTYPVVINLCHEVEAILMRDLGTIRYLDGVGFYELATPAGTPEEQT